MNYFIPGLLAVILCLLVASVVGGDSAKTHFTKQCNDKGGIVLSGLKMKQGKAGDWWGCYKGVTEIPNEE